MRYLEGPVVVNRVEGAEAATGIGGFIEVVFHPGAVIGGEEFDVGEIGPGLEALAYGANGDAIAAHRALGAEASAFLGGAGAGHVIDVAALLVHVDHAANRELIVDWQVHHPFDVVAHLAVFGEFRADFDVGIGARGIGLIGDETHRAGLGTGAEERALGAREDLHPCHIGGVDVQVPARLGQRLLVEVERHVGRNTGDACGGEIWRRGGDAADVDRVLPRSATTGRDARELD